MLKLVTVISFLLLSTSGFCSDTTDSRKEISAIMAKIISEKIKDGNFQYKGEVVNVSSGSITPGFFEIKFNSVIGTFVYIRWQGCQGMYLTKNSLGKMRSAYKSVMSQVGFKKKTTNLATHPSLLCLEYIDEEIPYIISYPSNLKELQSLEN